jgi:hypothetical protein
MNTMDRAVNAHQHLNLASGSYLPKQGTVQGPAVGGNTPSNPMPRQPISMNVATKTNQFLASGLNQARYYSKRK